MKNKFILLLIFLFSLSLSAEVLTFSKAYSLALKNSNNIKSSEYRFNSKKEDLNQYTSKLYPQINGNLSYSNSHRVLNDELLRSDSTEHEKSIDYGVSLNQSIYDAEIYSGIDVEKKRLKTFDIKLQSDKQELLHEVLKVYIDILKQNNKISLLESKMQYQKYLNKSLKKKFVMKLANKMDMLQSDVLFNTSKIDLKKETQLLYIYKSKLKHLIGEEHSLPKVNFNNTDFLDAEYLDTILNNNDLYLSSLKVKEALVTKEYTREEISNARSAHYPKLSLDLNYTDYNSKDVSADYENTKKVVVMLKIPIFQGGRVASKVESSKLLYKSTLEDLELTEKENKLKYEELKTYLFSSIESFNLYKESLNSASLYLESIEQGFKYGLKSIIDVSDAKIKLNEIKYSYIDTLFTMIDSYIGLLIITNDLDKINSIDKVFLEE